MSKFVLIFVAFVMSTVVAFPTRYTKDLQVPRIRMIRSAYPGPSYYNQYGDDYDGGYGDYNGGYGNQNYGNGGYGNQDYGDGGYGNQNYGNGYNRQPYRPSNSYSQSSANAGSVNSPYGSSSYANAQSNSGSDY